MHLGKKEKHSCHVLCLKKQGMVSPKTDSAEAWICTLKGAVTNFLVF